MTTLFVQAQIGTEAQVYAELEARGLDPDEVSKRLEARGIDVNNLTHVIHYTLPDSASYYTHRSGRTARAGVP